jgi:hypothetical protein
MTTCKSYSELISLPSFDERFRYLRLNGYVGVETFGDDRWLNQVFYKSPEWLHFRSAIIVRDSACDLGIEGRDIYIRPIVHHINPITAQDILTRNVDKLLNPENVITTMKSTHDAIHYGSELYLMIDFPERKPNDTIPWR